MLSSITGILVVLITLSREHTTQPVRWPVYTIDCTAVNAGTVSLGVYNYTHITNQIGVFDGSCIIHAPTYVGRDKACLQIGRCTALEYYTGKKASHAQPVVPTDEELLRWSCMDRERNLMDEHGNVCFDGRVDTPAADLFDQP